jgi:hypothetical protein
MKAQRAFTDIKTDGINVNGWEGERWKAYNASLHETIFI